MSEHDMAKVQIFNRLHLAPSPGADLDSASRIDADRAGAER